MDTTRFKKNFCHDFYKNIAPGFLYLVFFNKFYALILYKNTPGFLYLVFYINNHRFYIFNFIKKHTCIFIASYCWIYSVTQNIIWLQDRKKIGNVIIFCLI